MKILSETKVKLLAILALIGFLFGCASETRFQTNKVNDYAKSIKKMQIILNIADDYGPEFLNSFQKKIISILKECGTEVQVEMLSNQERDGRLRQRIETFKPETLLYINQTKRIVGSINAAEYDMKLHDLSSDKLVWRATALFDRWDTRLVSTNSRGSALAVDLRNQMTKDKILRSCSTEK